MRTRRMLEKIKEWWGLIVIVSIIFGATVTLAVQFREVKASSHAHEVRISRLESRNEVFDARLDTITVQNARIEAGVAILLKDRGLR